jgi:ABC-type sugar transport system substrate-binding protein
MSGKIITVGTDVFPELLPFFEDDTLTASIYQYPVQQGYMAVKAMVSDMTQTYFPYANLKFPATAVFKSNAEAFTQINDIVYAI